MKYCPTSLQASEIMECMELTTNFKDIVCNIYIVYHIPNTSVIQLCSELSDLMESNVLEDHGHLFMLGDINIYVDNPEHPDTIIFNDFLESFDLINFTTFPTHESIHTLDSVITSSHGLIKSIKQGHFLSDHCFVDSTLHVSRPVPPKKLTKFHKHKNINSTQLHGIVWRTNLNNWMIKLSITTQYYVRSWISMHQLKRRESGTVAINPGSMIK